MDSADNELDINLDVSQKAINEFEKLSIVSPMQLRDQDHWTLQKAIPGKPNPLGIVSQPRLKEAINPSISPTESSKMINSLNQSNQNAI